MKISSMSIRMKKIAIVENLIAKRPSATSIGSLPHSNGCAFTAVSRRGAMRCGIQISAPATAAAKANTMTTGTYSMTAHGGPLPASPQAPQRCGRGVNPRPS